MTAQLALEWAAKSAGKHEREIQALVPLVLDLARKAGRSGITVDNVLLAANHKGLMPLMGNGRQHSFLGAVCRAAGLRTTGERVRSEIEGKHGNWRSKWALPEYLRAA